jgi:hypothetical protein
MEKNGQRQSSGEWKVPELLPGAKPSGIMETVWGPPRPVKHPDQPSTPPSDQPLEKPQDLDGEIVKEYDPSDTEEK